MNKIYIYMLTSLLAGFPLSAYSYDYDEYADTSYPDYYDMAEPAVGFVDKGRVTHVEPVYETVTVHRPVTECWNERRTVSVSRPGNKRLAASVVGGIIGGVAGHQVGGGRGKDAATIAGAILGTAIGYNMGGKHRHGHHRETTYYSQEVCEKVDRPMREERVRGYRVEYRYQGQTFVTHADRRPGKWISLNVNVTPT